MATVVFFVYVEKADVNANLKLAKQLRRQGHRVCYVGLEDLESYVQVNGFEYIAVYKRYFPKGSLEEAQQSESQIRGFQRLRALKRQANKFKSLLENLAGGADEELLTVLKDLRPDLMLFSVDGPLTELAPMIAFAAGVKGAYFYSALAPCVDSNIPPMHTNIIPTGSLASIISVYLAWKKIYLAALLFSKVYELLGLFVDEEKWVKQLAKRFGYHGNVPDAGLGRHVTIQLPEIIVCPQAFEFPGAELPGRHYIEASIDEDRKQPSFPWERLDDGRPLIYCALGNLLWLRKDDYRRFFQAVSDASRLKPDWQWVLTVGSLLGSDDLSDVPSNALVAKEAPQLALLKRARLMITHGGINTIKECIYFGVPMLVFPLGAAPGNAARVIYHGLGLLGDLKKVTAQYLDDMIASVDNSVYIRSQMKLMQRQFKEMEEAKVGLRLIEDMLLQ